METTAQTRAISLIEDFVSSVTLEEMPMLAGAYQLCEEEVTEQATQILNMFETMLGRPITENEVQRYMTAVGL